MQLTLRNRIRLALAALITLTLTLGATLPANAAIGYPQPNPPGCGFKWVMKGIVPTYVADCSVDNTYAGLVRLSTKYLTSNNASMRKGAISAMIWTTLGASVVGGSKGTVKAISNTNRQYIQTAVGNISTGNAQIVCVRNVLLYYIVKSGQTDKLTTNAYQFWETAKNIDDIYTVFGLVRDDGGIGSYLELVNSSKAAVSYIGQTVQVRNTVNGLLQYCGN